MSSMSYWRRQNNSLLIIFFPRFGIYPLTAFVLQQPPPPSRPRAISPEAVDPVAPETTESTDQETRKVINMMCNIKRNENGQGLYVSILCWASMLVCSYSGALHQQTVQTIYISNNELISLSNLTEIWSLAKVSLSLS